MSVIEFLSQPMWQRLGLTLMHFLWQGVLVALLASMLIRAFRLSPGNTRYNAYLLAFIAIMACPIATFVALDGSLPPSLILPVTESRPETTRAQAFESRSFPVTEAHDVSSLTKTSISKPEAGAATRHFISLQNRIADYWYTSLPWALLVWMAGVVVLSGRLLLGFVGLYR